jgi:hypothetical protein
MRRRRRRRQQCKLRCVGPRCGATSTSKPVRTGARGRSGSPLLTRRARSSAIVAVLLFAGRRRRRFAHKSRPRGSSRHGHRGHHQHSSHCQGSGHPCHHSSSSVTARRLVKRGRAHQRSGLRRAHQSSSSRCAASNLRPPKRLERRRSKRPSLAHLRGAARASTAGAWPSSRTCA